MSEDGSPARTSSRRWRSRSPPRRPASTSRAESPHVSTVRALRATRRSCSPSTRCRSSSLRPTPRGSSSERRPARVLYCFRGRFWIAGLLAGLAVDTRVLGLALIPAMLILAWPVARKRGLLTLVPLVALPLAAFVAIAAYYQHAVGDSLAFLHAQKTWGRHVPTLGPLDAIWRSATATYHGIGTLAGVPSDSSISSLATENVIDFVLLDRCDRPDGRRLPPARDGARRLLVRAARDRHGGAGHRRRRGPPEHAALPARRLPAVHRRRVPPPRRAGEARADLRRARRRSAPSRASRSPGSSGSRDAQLRRGSLTFTFRVRPPRSCSTRASIIMFIALGSVQRLVMISPSSISLQAVSLDVEILHTLSLDVKSIMIEI